MRHAGTLELEERRDDFRPGDPNNDWPGMVDGLTAKIREHLGGRADLFCSDVSTTGRLERTASQVALPNTFPGPDASPFEGFKLSFTATCPRHTRRRSSTTDEVERSSARRAMLPA